MPAIRTVSRPPEVPPKTSPGVTRDVVCRCNLAFSEPFLLPVQRFPGNLTSCSYLNTSVWLEEKFSFRESRFVVKQSMVP
jgi:hypothetical protein